MPNETIRPTTIIGIKSLAKELKSRENISHSAALDKVAQRAGYQNFKHAHNQLSGGIAKPAGYTVYISTFWRTMTPRDAGQETLSMKLSMPLDQLLRPHQIKHARYLYGFRFTAPDHLVDEKTYRSQSDARRQACAAVRTLTFMQATGLKPSGARRRTYPGGSYQNRMPDMDHPSDWFDPEAKAYILVDEPYSRDVAGISEERQAWAKHFNWDIVKTSWGGVYNPEGHCEMYLAADKAKGYSLAKILKALNALAAPTIEEDWNGVSGPFESPGDKAKAATPKLAPVPRGKTAPPSTLGYHVVFDKRQRRRPAARMPIEAHLEVGKAINAVSAVCFTRAGVQNRLQRVRSDLDDWVQREYRAEELPDEQLDGMYYQVERAAPATASMGADWKNKQLGHLRRIKEILAQHYPDCAPLRALISSLDLAAKSIQAWAA